MFRLYMINRITVLFYHVNEKGFPGEEYPPEGGVTGIFSLQSSSCLRWGLVRIVAVSFKKDLVKGVDELMRELVKGEGIEEGGLRSGGQRKEVIRVRRIFCQLAVRSVSRLGPAVVGIIPGKKRRD